MSDHLRAKLGSAVVVLATAIDDKPQMIVAVTDDLVRRGVHAGEIVKVIARTVGGGGGGRPALAQAGGRDLEAPGRAGPGGGDRAEAVEVTKTVYLTSEDTLPAIQAKMRMVQADRVLFVIPAGLSLSAVDLRVLRRDAVAVQVGVALVTTDATLRGRAAREGISTFRSQSRGERARWRRLRGDPIPPRGVGTAVTTAPPAAGLFARRSPSGFRPRAFLRAYVRRRNPWWAVLGLTLALLLILGGMLYALTFILPSATITVAPAVRGAAGRYSA